MPFPSVEFANRRVLLVGLSCSLAACHDSVVVPSHSRPIKIVAFALSSNSLSASEQWDTFDADVAIRETLPSDRPAIRKTSPLLKLHRHSELAANGAWRLNLQFVDAEPHQLDRQGHHFPADLPTINIDENGAVKILNASGDLRSSAKSDRAMLEIFKSNAAKAGRAELKFSEAVPSLDPTEAKLRGQGAPALFASSRRDELATSLRAYFGPPSVKAEQAHYARQVGPRLTEIVVDESTGAVAEENLMVDGKLKQHVSHTYAPVGDGILLAVVTRIEQAVPGFSDPRVTEVTLTNVSFSLRGGAK